LPSVTWRTGQSGAPPDTVQCGFLSFFGEADRWRFRAVGAPDTVRCPPDSPMPPSDRWLCHASRADYVADRWPDRLLAHRTVRCTPTPPSKSQEQPVDRRQPGAPDTVRCTQTEQPFGCTQPTSPKMFLLFLALRHNTLVFKTMY
jgi:hypothetical protein